MEKNKVYAFTIMEVVISMLLTAIVFGICFSSYNIVNKFYLSYITKNRELQSVEMLDKLLIKDFNKALAIRKDSSGIDFEYPENSIRYEFKYNKVIRYSLLPDTFIMMTDKPNIFFENQLIENLSANDEENLLDQMDLTINLKGEKITYSYVKRYSSENLIQR